jgi:hypothetical protein
LYYFFKMRLSIWRGLALLSALIGIFLGSQAVGRVWTNYQLSQSTSGQVESWEVRQTGSDRFAVWAHYSYQLGEQKFEGADYLDRDTYRNPWTAERILEREPPNEVLVFHQASRPERSALGKQPVRQKGVMALMALALSLYFLWIGRSQPRTK